VLAGVAPGAFQQAEVAVVNGVEDSVSMDIVRNKLVSEALAADLTRYSEQYAMGQEIDLIHTVTKRVQDAKESTTPGMY